MYTNQSATKCAASAYCQLIRQVDMSYNASCSTPCADKCVNNTQIDCAVACCNSTGCLNTTFESMMMTTTTVSATTSARTTTTATTTTTTPVSTTTATSPANNENKCHQGVCVGATCYTAFKDAALQICKSSEQHCQLKKETKDSMLKWTAGCIGNCSGQTSCEADTKPPCYLECCNATVTSCLRLNVPSFATRGPYIHTELVACLLCLLAITLML
ncbi:integumentary mucin C.1-like [Seriola dumerili]|uniref:integumentary mucin C.1-like n=1 Tax=Seriola dumerili TaxID=41447 RepID=UPI000BBE8D82|nr:integumentary mucin C.1-like [Seriola dumerili]